LAAVNVETFRRAEIKHAVRRKSFRAMRSFHVARSFHDKAAGAVRTRLAELAHRRYLASDGASGLVNAAA
jgi:hypothetical protein